MLFNSLSFLIFFPVVTTLYFLISSKRRWMVLLVASCAFYMVFVPAYILILIGTIAIDYTAGLLIESSTGPARKLWLTLSIVANVGVLGFFKYFAFVNSSFVTFFTAAGFPCTGYTLHLLLPIGLSFHTFQAMSYTIEVYRGRQKAERHLGIYSLYVLFYPQLVAGPIERPQNLLHQFRQPQRFDFDRLCAGLVRMLWGMFKKVVIADRLALYVNPVYDSPATASRGALILATYLFAIQIYCDFSGYTDIALGAAQTMGFTLMENFNRPYAAACISDFWQRWHISLSTWFRDYLYFPLGGNRVPRGRWIFNIMVVFLISGLWHGANWTFVIWGALHGLYLLIERMTAATRQKLITRLPLSDRPGLRHWLGILVTFHLVCFAWIFFRAQDLHTAFVVIGRIFGPYRGGRPTPWGPNALLITLLLIVLLELVQWVQQQQPLAVVLSRLPVLVRWPVYYAMVVVILWIGVLGGRSFIYFQF